MAATTSKPGLITQTAIAGEYSALMGAGHCPIGMYTMPSTESLLIWDAVLFVHQGLYANAVLKFRITFPDNFPDRAPTVQFITDVFHPLISQEGAYNLGHRFRPWRPKEHHIVDVLHCVKTSFKKDVLDKLQLDDCVNKDAYRYHKSPQSFASLATQSVQLSQTETSLFVRDHPSRIGGVPHAMRFSKLNPDQTNQTKEKIEMRSGINQEAEATS
ncbi:UBC-like protein [Coprinopsis marcescibilis]|uniref:UBC-like protein n=1 Tax=Coprinopsis marcescibilis TaxID=230819 RepID=A0A5C3L7N0_COPMA|nr:UBC-like protein [Coprinopsis marcescibilis]